MSDLTIGQVLDIAGRLSSVSILFLALYGGYRKWWVFGWTYHDKVEECEKWEALALRGVTALETTTEAITPVAAKAARQ
jgi:hypothetical protein